MRHHPKSVKGVADFQRPQDDASWFDCQLNVRCSATAFNLAERGEPCAGKERHAAQVDRHADAVAGRPKHVIGEQASVRKIYLTHSGNAYRAGTDKLSG
jgi:hypothetical protein